MTTPLRFELTTPVLDDRPVYISGNFCDWYPDLEPFRLWPTGAGRYALDFPAEVPRPDVLEYKYTRGGWDQVELTSAGDVPPNRVTRRRTGILDDEVLQWRWFGQSFNPDYLPRLGMLEPAFLMPQLQTTRRVRVLLPYDYDQSDKRYPVLYLHDGQNLIGGGSDYGSWEIDRRLAVLASRQRHEVIVVAIDHGEDNRIREFTLERTMAGTGNGINYLAFIAETLKSTIDASFRTKPDAAHTGIGGSSMGGLISVYAGVRYPHVFGRLLIFSPSLWIAGTVFADAARYSVSDAHKWYIFGGENESKHMISSIKRLADALARSPAGKRLAVRLVIHPTATHSELYWGQEFPKAVDWLF